MLRVGDAEVIGHTLSVSPSSLHLRTSHPRGAEAFPPRAPVTFRLLGRSVVEGNAELVAAEEELDELGRAFLGLELSILAPETRGALQGVIETERPTVLVVEPDPAVASALAGWVEPQLEVTLTGSVAAGIEALRSLDAAALVVDAGLGGRIAALWAASAPGAARILTYQEEPRLAQVPGVGTTAACLRKPLSRSEVVSAVRRAVDAARLTVENERLSRELERRHQQLRRENVYLKRKQAGGGFAGILGKSATLQRMLSELDAVRPSDTTVHVHGETGTGKELVARGLHDAGPRAHNSFIAQSCAGISESLLQSTLFGHRKGAFTGAHKDHAGVFEQAHRGTLFLDEVSGLSPVLQAALLRAVQEGEVTPLGARTPVKVDVRIISASSTDLKSLVASGGFREDLYFRLVVFAIEVPPLREREGDVELLARHFLSLQCQRHGKTLRGFDQAALEALRGYSWPGNVRELENEIERLVVLADEGEGIGVDLLSEPIQASAGRAGSRPQLELPDGLDYDHTLEHVSRELIRSALEASGGNLTRAARALGMDRSRLGKLRLRLGMDREPPG